MSPDVLRAGCRAHWSRRQVPPSAGKGVGLHRSVTAAAIVAAPRSMERSPTPVASGSNGRASPASSTRRSPKAMRAYCQSSPPPLAFFDRDIGANPVVVRSPAHVRSLQAASVMSHRRRPLLRAEALRMSFVASGRVSRVRRRSQPVLRSGSRHVARGAPCPATVVPSHLSVPFVRMPPERRARFETGWTVTRRIDRCSAASEEAPIPRFRPGKRSIRFRFPVLSSPVR